MVINIYQNKTLLWRKWYRWYNRHLQLTSYTLRVANLAKRHDRWAACGNARALHCITRAGTFSNKCYSLQSKTCCSLLYLQCDLCVGEVASAGTPLTVCWIWKVQKQSALQDRTRTNAGQQLQKNIPTTFPKQISPQWRILIRRSGLAVRPSAGPDLRTGFASVSSANRSYEFFSKLKPLSYSS